MSRDDHYFSAHPASDGELRRQTVRLAGRDVEVEVAGGIFSPDGVDKGTRVLLDEASAVPPVGTFLDLGCGWGPLALTLAMESPAAVVHAVDVNERALDLCRRNADRLGLPGVVATTPDAVDPAIRFDLIWSNPPIRVGKEALHGLMTMWLPRLAPGGSAFLVVQRNLGADSLHTWLRSTLPDLLGSVTVERIASSKGFRVLRATHG